MILTNLKYNARFFFDAEANFTSARLQYIVHILKKTTLFRLKSYPSLAFRNLRVNVSSTILFWISSKIILCQNLNFNQRAKGVKLLFSPTGSKLLLSNVILLKMLWLDKKFDWILLVVMFCYLFLLITFTYET